MNHEKQRKLNLINRFPEFDFIAFDVENSAEFSVIAILCFVKNVNAFGA